MYRAFIHLELNTGDTEAAKAFYRKVFSWDYHEVDMGDVVYTQILTPSGPRGGMQPTAMKNAPSQWLPYVGVDSVEKALERVRAAGGTIVVPYVPVSGYGALAIVADPSGAQFGLWEVEASGADAQDSAATVDQPAPAVSKRRPPPPRKKAAEAAGSVAKRPGPPGRKPAAEPEAKKATDAAAKPGRPAAKAVDAPAKTEGRRLFGRPVAGSSSAKAEAGPKAEAPKPAVARGGGKKAGKKAAKAEAPKPAPPGKKVAKKAEAPKPAPVGKKVGKKAEAPKPAAAEPARPKPKATPPGAKKAAKAEPPKRATSKKRGKRR